MNAESLTRSRVDQMMNAGRARCRVEQPAVCPLLVSLPSRPSACLTMVDEFNLDNLHTNTGLAVKPLWERKQTQKGLAFPKVKIAEPTTHGLNDTHTLMPSAFLRSPKDLEMSRWSQSLLQRTARMRIQ